MPRVSLLLLAISISLSAQSAQSPTPSSPPAASSSDKQRDIYYEGGNAKPESMKPAIPRGYALVVGISHYKNLPAKAQLEFPDRDAESIYKILISAEGGQFPPENVHVLVDENATLANIRKELETWLPGQTKDNDRVLVYFAGHGFISNGKGFLAPYDVDPAHVEASAYSMDTLGSDIGSKIKGKWKVLLTDACHSGAITPEADRAQLNRTLLDMNKSLFSLTASRDREQSFETSKLDGGHGVFTYYVVAGLEGQADTNGDGLVTADELAEYVHENVREYTKALQNPTSEKGSFEAGMPLSYNPTHVKSTKGAPPKAGSIVVETNMDGVEVWVDGQSHGVVNKSEPLRLTGMQPGQHTIKGVHMGYEPDGPREEMVYPGQDTTVSLRILIARRPKRAALGNFDRGVEFYDKGYPENYKKALEQFEQALSIEPKFSKAALYMGRAYSALDDTENARKYMKLAIDTDPDYMEARASYAGVLMDTGDMDEAIRELTVVTTRERQNAMGWYLLSEAYRLKGDYADGVTTGQKATSLAPNNAEAHLWLGDSLRLLNRPSEAEPEYKRYLALSNFNSGVGGKLNYYILGSLSPFGGKKKRAGTQDIWKELHSRANFGVCVCEWQQKNYDSAIPYCQTALSFDPNDLYSNYRLGVLFVQKFNALSTAQQSAGLPLLAAARKHFSEVVMLNPDVNEAAMARKNVQTIDQALTASERAAR